MSSQSTGRLSKPRLQLGIALGLSALAITSLACVTVMAPFIAKPTQALAVPTIEVAVPTEVAEVPTEVLEVPTEAVEAPTEVVEAPTQEGAEPTFPEIERVPLEDAKAAYAAGSAVFVDVRSSAEYDQSHIPGALSIPVNELEGRLDELDKSQWIITYCT